MFNFRFDKKNIIIIAIAIGMIWLIRHGREHLLATLLSLPAILIGLTFHEFAHAYAAVKLRR